jgi:hypothetical protein
MSETPEARKRRLTRERVARHRAAQRAEMVTPPKFVGKILCDWPVPADRTVPRDCASCLKPFRPAKRGPIGYFCSADCAEAAAYQGGAGEIIPKATRHAERGIRTARDTRESVEAAKLAAFGIGVEGTQPGGSVTSVARDLRGYAQAVRNLAKDADEIARVHDLTPEERAEIAREAAARREYARAMDREANDLVRRGWSDDPDE